MNRSSQHPEHKPRPFIDLLVSIIIPSIILMKLSGDEYLGSVYALLIGLAFPLGWGLFELIRYRKKNFIAVLGMVSVGLTGGIGLFEIDAQWLAVKEAAIPAIIGGIDFHQNQISIIAYTYLQPQGAGCGQDSSGIGKQ